MKPAGSTLPFYAVIVAAVVVVAVVLAKCNRVPPELPVASPRSTPGPVPFGDPAAENSVAHPTVAPVVSPGGTASIGSPETRSEVAIQDGKTIDFSSGKPVLRDTAKEKEVIDLAVKEMDAAANSITFGPAAPTPTSVTTPPPAVTPH